MLLDFLLKHSDGYFLLAIILYAFVEAIVDAYAQMSKTYSRRQGLSHRWGWTGRAFVVTAATALLYGFDVKSLTMLIRASLLFWFYFELFLNWKKGQDWFYVGKTAWTDRQIRNLTALLSRKFRTPINPIPTSTGIKALAACIGIVLSLLYPQV